MMIFWGNWSVPSSRYETSHIITFHFLKTSTRSQIKPKIEILVFSTRCIVYRKVYFYCTSYEYTFQDLLYNFSYTTDISNLIFNHNINLYKTPLIIWVSICSGTIQSHNFSWYWKHCIKHIFKVFTFFAN